MPASSQPAMSRSRPVLDTNQSPNPTTASRSDVPAVVPASALSIFEVNASGCGQARTDRVSPRVPTSTRVTPVRAVPPRRSTTESSRRRASGLVRETIAANPRHTYPTAPNQVTPPNDGATFMDIFGPLVTQTLVDQSTSLTGRLDRQREALVVRPIHPEYSIPMDVPLVFAVRPRKKRK
jgi:hypothetical protein